MYISTDRLRASILEESFFDFVQHFWDTVVPEEPIWNWHLPYLCNELQMVAERVFENKPKKYDLIINISPGTTKSTICSVMFPTWVWTRLPSARSICGSYAHMLALDLSRKSRLVVQSEKYRKLWPEITLSEDQNTKGFYTTNAGGGRLAVGSGGSVTGFHAHFIIPDDPLDPNGAFSEADIRNVNNWMRETLPTRKIDKAVTPTILIMQRLHENDPTGEWLERTKGVGIKHICLPAEVADVPESELTAAVNPPECLEHYVDGLMDPVRLSKPILEDSERTLGAYGYACQFLQTPIPRGGGSIKAYRIQIDEAPRHFVRCVRYWDKAGTRGGGAFTVGCLMGVDRHGRYWVLDIVRGQWDAFEREEIIKKTAENDTVSVLIGVEQEPGSGGKESAQATVRRLAGYNVRMDRPVGDKELRADPFATQVNGENIYMKKAAWNLEYLDELKYFPRGKYKDQVDASSGAFAMLTKVKRRAGGL